MHDYCTTCSVAICKAVPDFRCCHMERGCLGHRNESWKLRRLRVMFVIPIVVFPLALLLALVYSSSLQQTPDQTSRSDELPLPEQYSRLELVNPETFIPNEENADESDVHDVLHELQTNFVPPPVNYEHAPAKYVPSTSRQKRQANDMLTPLLRRFAGNVSNEEIVWTIAQPFDIEHSTNMSESTEANTTWALEGFADTGVHEEEDYTYPGEELNMNEENNYFEKVPIPHSLSNNDSDDDKKPDDTGEDESYLERDMNHDDFPPVKTGELPWYEDDDDPDVHIPRDDVDNKLSDNLQEDVDFHAFWRDEGSRETIRRTQSQIMRKAMDRSVNPCEDFYQYACGNWEKLNPIPKDEGGYDTFEKLRESLDSVLKDLLEAPMSDTPFDIHTRDATIKAKILYQSCMNSELLVKRGTGPLLELLDTLGGWPILQSTWNPENFDWLRLTAQLRRFNNDILIAEWVGPDIKNSDEYVIQIDQSSLGLPSRDYFLSPSNSRYLEAYTNFMMKIVELLGAPTNAIKEETQRIIDFETELARITISTEERRSVTELYRRMTFGKLRSLLPQIDWYRYLAIVLDRDILVDEPIVVFTIQFFEKLVKLIEKTPPRVVANYLLWRFVRHRVNNLDDRFLDVKQDLYNTLFGREQSPPRWKTCVGQVNSNIGMALGAMFVRNYFDETSKNDTLQMTEAIMQSFRQLLKHNTWIDPETKDLAHLKVDAMLLRIGYPNFILNPDLLDARYMDITLYPDEYFENTLKVLQHLTIAEQARLGGPVNKTVWNTAPAVVNAYYSRNRNQIMFPAGILQPPFYHRFFPRSLNYGGIGVVIGHELTHGFDDKGRLFDHNGNLQRWWRDESIDNFHARAQCLIDQYSNFIVEDVNMAIDGVSTQGENIADNGGIKQAFRAYKNWMRYNKLDGETLPGMNATGEELFFINFAQVWCGSMRPEAMRNKLKVAVHSPGRFRVIGSLSNSKDFARVFKCPTGSPMNPKEKCSVW